MLFIIMILSKYLSLSLVRSQPLQRSLSSIQNHPYKVFFSTFQLLQLIICHLCLHFLESKDLLYFFLLTIKYGMLIANFFFSTQ